MHTNIKFVKPCKHEHFFCLKTDNSILNLVPLFLLKTYCTWKTHNQGNQGNFKNPNWEIPYQIIQKKSKSILSPSKFLLLWTLVRYTKIREKSKISGPGKFKNPTFSVVQNWALGTKYDCHNAEMATALC